MANVFDASYGDRGLSRTGGRTRDDESCRGDIDWERGLQGIPKRTAKSTDVSGSLLTKVIEGEIIPRLLMAHQAPQTKPVDAKPVHAKSRRAAGPRDADIVSSESFAQLVLSSESDEILDKVDQLRRSGVKLERIFLDFLAPVARKLGEFWEEDRCTFADVTLGLARLHQVLHEIGRREASPVVPRAKRRAYFVPSPGEQHTFGLSMLEEFFLHAGWETACDYSASATSILETAAAQRLDIIGFSVGCEEFLGPLSDLIARTRIASCNPDVAIMVGGRLFSEHPELAAKLGAATVVCDGVHAVQMAERLVSRIPDAQGQGKLV